MTLKPKRCYTKAFCFRQVHCGLLIDAGILKYWFVGARDDLQLPVYAEGTT